MKGLLTKLMIVLLAINIEGCVTYSPVPTAPPTQPDLRSWADVPCDIVASRNRPACLVEHELLGIPANQSVQSAAQSGSQSTEAMRIAAHVPETPEEMQAARAAVDSMLGRTLKDPLSATQYRVSDALPCEQVLPGVAAQLSLRLCICYQINAKNSFGGYTGSELALATLFRSDANSYVAIAIPKELTRKNGYVMNACYDANLQVRDAALIHAAAQ